MIFNVFRDGFYVLFTSEQEEYAESIIKKVIPLIKKRRNTKEISLVISISTVWIQRILKLKNQIYPLICTTMTILKWFTNWS